MKLRSNLRRILIITVALYLLFLDSISPGVFLVASLFMLAGQAFQLASYAVLVKNTRITKEGPYAVIRHPFYVGTMLSDLGICLLSGNWVITLVYMTVFSFVYFRRVLKEENFLINKFGREYREYARLTPRFLPRIRFVAQLRSSTYSVDPSLVFKNRVIPRIMNMWAFFLAASELSDLRWGGDALWSMDHLVLLIVCMALLLLAAFLDSMGKRLKKATAQAGIVPDQEASKLTPTGQDEPCIIEAGEIRLQPEGL